MEKLNQSEEVLKLGRKLTKELNLQSHSNVLEKWMSQYIAELLIEIESTKSKTKQKELKKECFDTILSLWTQREYFPEKIAPLSNIPGLISVLSAFKQRDYYWEYRRFRDNLTNPWGIFACKIKDITEELIQLSVAAAIANDNFDKEKEWLEHHGGVLNEEEQQLIETIDSLVQNNSFPFRIKGEDINIGSMKPQERHKLIIEKLKNAVDGLCNSIKSLKGEIQKKKMT